MSGNADGSLKGPGRREVKVTCTFRKKLLEFLNALGVTTDRIHLYNCRTKTERDNRRNFYNDLFDITTLLSYTASFQRFDHLKEYIVYRTSKDVDQAVWEDFLTGEITHEQLVPRYISVRNTAAEFDDAIILSQLWNRWNSPLLLGCRLLTCQRYKTRLEEGGERGEQLAQNIQNFPGGAEGEVLAFFEDLGFFLKNDLGHGTLWTTFCFFAEPYWYMLKPVVLKFRKEYKEYGSCWFEEAELLVENEFAKRPSGVFYRDGAGSLPNLRLLKKQLPLFLNSEIELAEAYRMMGGHSVVADAVGLGKLRRRGEGSLLRGVNERQEKGRR